MAFSAKTKVRVLFRCYDGRKTIPLMVPMSPIRMYLLSPWDCTHGWLGAPLNSVSFRSLSFLSPPHKFILTFQIAFVKLDPSKQADLKLLLNESCLIAAGASDETRHVLLKLCGAEGVTDARNLWENEDGRRLVSGEKRGVDPLIPFGLRELRLRHVLSKQKVMNLALTFSGNVETAKGFSCKIGEVSLDVLECGQFKRIMMSFRQISWPQRLPRYTPQGGVGRLCLLGPSQWVFRRFKFTYWSY